MPATPCSREKVARWIQDAEGRRVGAITVRQAQFRLWDLREGKVLARIFGSLEDAERLVGTLGREARSIAPSRR